MSRLRRFLKNDSGLTLVEVIVAILIFSIVVIAIFRFLNFGVDAFSYGVEKTDEQAEFRLAMYRLTGEARNVFLADVVTDESSVTNDRNFLIVEGKQLLVKRKDAVGTITTVTQLTSAIVENSSFEIIVEAPILPHNPNKYTLVVNLDGEITKMNSSILLNNIQDIDTSGAGTDSIFEFSMTPN